MKLYSVNDNYINYLRKFDTKVYDNKENNRKVMRKYLGIVLKINELNYYIPMSSPKKSDYNSDNSIRKSIIPIIRVISDEEVNHIPVLKGTLRISNMIPVPDSELILYEPKYEKNENYKILVEKDANPALFELVCELSDNSDAAAKRLLAYLKQINKGMK